MANQTIPNLPAAVSLNGTEQIWAVQAGTDVRITPQQIANFTTGISPPFPVTSGGTGDTSFTSYALIYGNGIGPLQTVTPPTGSNWVLVGSPNAAPSWQPTIPVTAGVDSINTGTTGLLVGNTSGQSPVGSTPVSGVVTLSGTLNVANGGTGLATIPAYSLIIGNGASTVSTLPAVASGSVLVSTGTSSAPAYSSSPTLSGTTTSAAFIANENISGSLNAGAFSYGSLSFSDTYLFSSYSVNANAYAQVILQNTNSGATASTDIVVNNNLGTASTYYGNFGINSSGYTGSGSFNLPNATYLYSANGDLALGTSTSNAIHFVVNSGATDAATISSAGILTLANALPVNSGGTGQTSSLTQYGVVYGSTTTAMATTATGTTGQPLLANTTSGPAFGNLNLGTANINVTGTLTVTNGGTGASTFTSNGVLYGNGTNAVQVSTAGTTGQPLLANTSSGPAFGNLNLGTANTNITGTLTVTNGGTGQSSNLTQYGVVYGSTTTAMATTTAGTTGQPLLANTSSGPAFGNLNLGTANINVTGTLTVTNGGTGASTFTSNGVLYGNGTNAVQVSTAGTTGQPLLANTSSGPAFGNLNIGTANTNVTGTLTVTNGGTGQSSNLTQYGVVYGSTTTAMATTTAGTTGQPLLANTTSGPAFGNLNIGTANTNVTGTLTVTNGGTGAATLTSNGVLYGNGTGAVQALAQAASGTILTGTGAAPAFSATPTITTSVTVPVVIGGTTASSTLTLQSTSGAGTTDSILFKTGSNGAVTALTIASNGNATFLSTSTTAMGTATISTSATTPLVIGGTGTGSTLTLQSTSGAGTTDSILLKTGSNGAVTALTVSTTGAATFNSGVAVTGNFIGQTSTTQTATVTLGTADILGGFIVGTPAAAATYTTPAATAIDTALNTPPTGAQFEVVIFSTAAFVITLAGGSGVTVVGTATTAGTANAFARFRFRKTGAGAYSAYRVS